MAGVARPQLAARGRPRTLVEQLERADDPLAVGRRGGARRLRVAGGELGVQRGGALSGEPARVVLPAGRIGGRAQVEVGERRAEVEPGAADDDRPAARRDQPVDLRVSEARELARGRAAASTGRIPSSRCSSRARCCGVAAPVRISSPR